MLENEGGHIYPKSFNNGGSAKIGFTATEHNQAVLATTWVRKHLEMAGVVVTATDSTGQIIKACEKAGPVWHVASQSHPETQVVSKDKIAELGEELSLLPSHAGRAKEILGVLAANKLMQSFASASKQHRAEHSYPQVEHAVAESIKDSAEQKSDKPKGFADSITSRAAGFAVSLKGEERGASLQKG